MAAKGKLEVIAKKRGITVPALLAQEFKKHGNQKKVADALDVSTSTVHYALLVYDLEPRTVLCAKGTTYELTEMAKGE